MLKVMKMQPATKTAAKAAWYDKPRPRQIVKVKKAFVPMPRQGLGIHVEMPEYELQVLQVAVQKKINMFEHVGKQWKTPTSATCHPRSSSILTQKLLK